MGDVPDCAPLHSSTHVGEGRGGFVPWQHGSGPLQGAEGQTGGASHPQQAGPVHQHPLGGGAQRLKADRADGGDAGVFAAGSTAQQDLNPFAPQFRFSDTQTLRLLASFKVGFCPNYLV